MTERGTNIGAIAAEIVSDIGFRRVVKRLHRLGPRVLAEFLAELAAERNIRVIVERKVNKYASLDPEALQATAGNSFSPLPLHQVRKP